MSKKKKKRKSRQTSIFWKNQPQDKRVYFVRDYFYINILFILCLLVQPVLFLKTGIQFVILRLFNRGRVISLWTQQQQAGYIQLQLVDVSGSRMTFLLHVCTNRLFSCSSICRICKTRTGSVASILSHGLNSSLV